MNLQISVGSVDQTAEDVLLKLAQIRTKLKGRLLDRDSLPLWKTAARRELGESRTVFNSVNSRWISITSFLKENKGVLAFLCRAAIGVVGVRQTALRDYPRQAASR